METSESALRKKINLRFREGYRFLGLERPKHYDSHYVDERTRSSNWYASRGYSEYNRAFSSLTDVDIDDFIKYKLNNGSKVNIFEFGLGKGVFAKDIKSMFGDRVIYDGLTYDKYSELDSLREKKLIDDIHYVRAEDYKFSKSYDLMVDFFGPVFYLDPVSMTRLVLKSVSHLSNGGIYLIGFNKPNYGRSIRIFEFLRSKGYNVLQSAKSVVIIKPPIPKIIGDTL